MTGPHQNQSLVTAGTDIDDAEAAVVLAHGRGASAESIVQQLGREVHREVHREGVALLAPQAARNTWYPNSFLAPAEQNEPGRSSGLESIGDAVEAAVDAGISHERVLLVGFSQGGCLASEFVARNPRRYGGLAVLSGGLIGESVDPDDYLAVEGDLDDTPVFLGCSDVDPHIPEERVHATAEVLENLGGDVTTRIYEGMGHGVNADELDALDGLVAALV
ncbi:phospholipase [Halorientalis sp. IM1011]|uniref:alpha/beta hydrolase n=1 Tax=Halorientalis sp. IM1011 TaxID=1932360 RepID=UPI00097CD25A|nr:dienelactone hydrolase family protein [Halorientalis sp. IM1011]AQL43954.1 phospholipase [Halorientalis sp. IM1011]